MARGVRGTSRGYTVPSRRRGRDRRRPKLLLQRGGGDRGGRNSASNTVLASLMNGWQGWTCGVGRLLARGIGSSVWRAAGVVPAPSLPPRHPPRPTPRRSVCIRAACGSAFRSRTRMLPAVSSRNRNSRRPPLHPLRDAGRDERWSEGSPRVRSGRRKHAGAN